MVVLIVLGVVALLLLAVVMGQIFQGLHKYYPRAPK